MGGETEKTRNAEASSLFIGNCHSCLRQLQLRSIRPIQSSIWVRYDFAEWYILTWSSWPHWHAQNRIFAIFHSNASSFNSFIEWKKCGWNFSDHGKCNFDSQKCLIWHQPKLTWHEFIATQMASKNLMSAPNHSRICIKYSANAPENDNTLAQHFIWCHSMLFRSHVERFSAGIWW